MENNTTVVHCYAWGLSNKGQLGSAIHTLKSLNAVKIPSIQDGLGAGGYFESACGENHTLLLTDQMEILSCGSNTYGQLGIGSSPMSTMNVLQQQVQNQQQPLPQTTLFRLKNIVSVSGANLNSTSSLEGGNSPASNSMPYFQQVSCGSEHSYALSKDGEVYSWGLNFKGQLGLGDFENRNEPTLVESLIPIDSQYTLQSKKNLL